MIFLLSGPMASGKSRLALNLSQRLDFASVSTSAHLKKLLGTTDRQALSTKSAELCKANPNWIVDLVKERCVFDAVRTTEQVKLIREKFFVTVFHVHLVTSDTELLRRYLKRGLTEEDYNAARRHPMESHTLALQEIADLVVDTGVSTKEETLKLVLELL